jgi:hypothetical protein
VGGGGRKHVLSMLAAFQSFCYDNALPLSALHHRRANQQIQHCANPIHCRMRPTLANAGGGAGTATTTTQRNTPGGLRGLHTLSSSCSPTLRRSQQPCAAEGKSSSTSARRGPSQVTSVSTCQSASPLATNSFIAPIIMTRRGYRVGVLNDSTLKIRPLSGMQI